MSSLESTHFAHILHIFYRDYKDMRAFRSDVAKSRGSVEQHAALSAALLGHVEAGYGGDCSV